MFCFCGRWNVPKFRDINIFSGVRHGIWRANPKAYLLLDDWSGLEHGRLEVSRGGGGGGGPF